MSGHHCIELAGRIELGFGLEAYPIHSVATTSGILRGGSRGVTRVTSHPPPWSGNLFHVIIMRMTNSQTLKFHSRSRKPRPPQCSLASLARVPKVTPSKNPIGPPMILPKITVLFFGTSQQVDHRNVFSTLPRKTWTLIAGRRPVYRTERPPLCTAQCV